MAFVFRAVDEVGATLNTALGRDGRQARLLPRDGRRHARSRRPSSPSGPAPSEHYAREWLNAQAAGGYVEYDAGDAPVHAARRARRRAHRPDAARPTCPASSRSRSAPSATPPRASTRRRATATASAGTSTTATSTTAASGSSARCTTAHLLAEWLPALDGVVDEARARARTVADVGCGHGASTILHGAGASRASTFVGSDYHADSIEIARERAARGRGRRPRDVRGRAGDRLHRDRATTWSTMFDCLHDMGDPVGAARHVREAIAADGTWMIVEPMAGDRVEDNLNPVGRAYYGFSTLLCTPASLSPGRRSGAGHAGRAGADPRRLHGGRVHARSGPRRAPRSTTCSRSGRDVPDARARAASRLLGWARTRAGPRDPDVVGRRRAGRRPARLRGVRPGPRHRPWC